MRIRREYNPWICSSLIILNFRPTMISCNLFDIGLYYIHLFRPEMKTAILAGKIDYRNLRSLFRRIPGVLEEKFADPEFGIRVSKNNFMYHNIEDTMRWLIQSGIPKFHINFITDTALWCLDDDPYQPKVFSLKNLEFGFVTWLGTCVASIFIFILEISYCRIKIWIWNYFISPHFLNFLANRNFV